MYACFNDHALFNFMQIYIYIYIYINKCMKWGVTVILAIHRWNLAFVGWLLGCVKMGKIYGGREDFVASSALGSFFLIKTTFYGGGFGMDPYLFIKIK